MKSFRKSYHDQVISVAENNTEAALRGLALPRFFKVLDPAINVDGTS